MKFVDKYELSDAVTTGRLETFMGRDVASGASVLVHIFDAPVKKPDQPTVLWVLESFRAVAPEAPGLVIAAGRYGATSFAYLVTRVPDDAALRQWKQAYESSTAETREIPVERKTIPPATPPAVLSRPNDGEAAAPASLGRTTSPPTGFFEMRSPTAIDASPSREVVPSPGTSSGGAGSDLEGINFGPLQDAPRREPGDFTKQFFVGSPAPIQPPPKQVPFESAAPRTDRIEAPEASGVSGPSSRAVDNALPDLGGFTALFRPNLKPEIPDSARKIDAVRKVDDAKAGDFTKFFQGPFDGERPAEIPDFSPNVSSTPRGKVAGEFTQVFGSSKDNPFAAISSSAGSEEKTPLRNEPGSFTRSFADAGQLSSVIEPPSSISEIKGNASPRPPAFPEPTRTQPAPSPLEPAVKPPDAPVAPKLTPRESRPSVQGGATQLFSVPGGHSAPTLPPPPSGPSEYTRIISGGMVGRSASEEKSTKEEEAAEAGSLPTFKMAAPEVPKAPKIAAPPAPKLPPIAAPAAPKVPPLGALVPKPKASYLPMIIILNASLIIAVLLIVYFAIKH